MPTKRKSSGRRRGASEQAVGSTSTASRGLVLHVIRANPESEWVSGFVQQLGEKFFGVERFDQLSSQQRAGWIRFNNAMARIGCSVARGEGDFQGFLKFLERVAEDEGDGDLAQVEAEVEALAKGHEEEGAEDAKGPSRALIHEAIQDRQQMRAMRGAVHAQKMRDWEARRKIQLAWDGMVLGVTVFCVLFSAFLIVLGVTSHEPRLIGGSAVTAGIAMVGLLKLVVWGKWNPPPPRQFR